MILEPAYRKLHKLKEMATEENVSPKIRAEIDAIIDLLKVSDAIFFKFTNIDSIYIHG